MEHRWSVRKPHRCRVVVESPRTGPVGANLCNIGIGGMFVEIDGVDLPLNAPVSVAFTLGRENYREDFRLPAMVVRRMPDGAGIMFLESDVDRLRALRGALYGIHSPLAAPTGSSDRRRAVLMDIRVLSPGDDLTGHQASAH
jgi:PilZ domain